MPLPADAPAAPPQDKRQTPEKKERETLLELAAQLPGFDRLAQRVESEKSRIAKFIDEAKSRFNRSAALTAVLVGALVALEPLQQLKPDERQTRKDNIAGVISDVYKAIPAIPNPETCTIGGGKCTANEKAAYATAHAVRAHLELIKDKIVPPGTGTGTTVTAKDIQDAVAAALSQNGFLKNAIQDEVADALIRLPKTENPEPSTMGIEGIIADAIVVALKDTSGSRNESTDGIRNTMQEAAVAALKDQRLAQLESTDGIRKAIQNGVRDAVLEILKEPVNTEINVGWKNKEDVLKDIGTKIQEAINAAIEKATVPSKPLTLDAKINGPNPVEIEALAKTVGDAVQKAIVAALATEPAPEISVNWKNKDTVLEDIGTKIQEAINAAVEKATVPNKTLTFDAKINGPNPVEIEALAKTVGDAVQKAIVAALATEPAPEISVNWKNKDTVLEDIGTKIQEAINAAVEKATVPNKPITLDATINGPTPEQIEKLVASINEAIHQAPFLPLALSVVTP